MILIIIYNANTVIINQSFDWLHKMVSPETYTCTLCQLTHGQFGAKTDWDNFITKVELPVIFYHKNEFLKQFPNSKLNFPWIGLKNDSHAFETILDATQINQLKRLTDLLIPLEQKINHSYIK